jgi:hypothetical protein
MGGLCAKPDNKKGREVEIPYKTNMGKVFKKVAQ